MIQVSHCCGAFVEVHLSGDFTLGQIEQSKIYECLSCHRPCTLKDTEEPGEEGKEDRCSMCSFKYPCTIDICSCKCHKKPDTPEKCDHEEFKFCLKSIFEALQALSPSVPIGQWDKYTKAMTKLQSFLPPSP